MRMSTTSLLLVLIFSGVFSDAMQLPMTTRATTASPSMRMPVNEPLVQSPQNRADEPCAFFGGGGSSVPEGAKCIFRPNAPCNRKKCGVNKGPCKNNHASMK
eukprot:CAMPEP_0174729704 /NCGR_PEP_ID=MMETSP1094-20130205/54198_1 /TAXON_ID=156173 /ORGANISM="Chrysochromulina brevifilum, Strain UTEX LB 985" /LENGTH=101 /DNA_ID=CAMNT_0015931853 /DNA_START=31 /DNA_END=336 /DNA_ORIENTATION=+